MPCTSHCNKSFSTKLLPNKEQTKLQNLHFIPHFTTSCRVWCNLALYEDLCVSSFRHSVQKVSRSHGVSGCISAPVVSSISSKFKSAMFKNVGFYRCMSRIKDVG